ncbi:NADH-cytochrome b5 reductase-like isoform X2 [Lycorma delicatula]|uniref:NADH-cytochrome b5 reductase-like isoform X2 n=1 Tax=Lycorma delicatula TaxID=130591 RepID=UPI003F514881
MPNKEFMMDECTSVDSVNHPSKPEAPSDSDCCNSGCNPCVFDLYEIRLSEWNKGKEISEQLSNIRYDLLSETKFKPFIVLKKYNITHNVLFFRFQPSIKVVNCETALYDDSLEQNISGTLPYRPGQHFTIKSSKIFSKYLENNVSQQSLGNEIDKTSIIVSSIKCDNKSKERNTEPDFITRAYTPISLSSLEMNCCFNMVVKLYESGKMSNYFRNVNIGDISYFRGPYGTFQYTSNLYRSVLMICIGTGIAPIYSIAKYILSNENDEAVIKLLYGCRKIDDVLLRDELRDMASYWNFSAEIYLSSDENNIVAKFGEHFKLSRIDEAVVFKELDSVKKDSCLILICGTTEFSDAMLSIVLKYGVDRKNIHIF